MINYKYIIKIFLILFLLFSIGVSQENGNKVSDSDNDPLAPEGKGTGVSYPRDLEEHIIDSESQVDATNLPPDTIIENDGASNRITYASATGTSPVTIKRKIVSPKREDGYFKDDEIVVQITVTSVNKKGLENVEIWEIPGPELEIINCSFPIVTSSIPQILDYEKSDKARLRYEDLNVKNIIKLLQIRNTTQLKRIYELIPPKEQDVINFANVSNLDSNTSKNLAIILLLELNKIIESKSTQDLNASFFNQMPGALHDGLDYWIDENNSSENNNYFKLEDYRFIKRRLLERAFFNESNPGIRILSFNKLHENMPLDNLLGINYRVPNLRDRETIIFKYYLRPVNEGISDLRSIIRSSGYRQEETIFINVIKHDAEFDVEQIFEAKDVDEDEPSVFKYRIEYMGGDLLEGKSFNISISAPTHFEIESVEVLNETNGTFSGDTKEKSKTLNFKKGEWKYIVVKGFYSESKDKLSSPIITIEGEAKNFEPDISVYPGWYRWMKIHAELSTILVLILTLIISNGITIYLKISGKKNRDDEFKRLIDAIANVKENLQTQTSDQHQTTVEDVKKII